MEDTTDAYLFIVDALETRRGWTAHAVEYASIVRLYASSALAVASVASD